LLAAFSNKLPVRARKNKQDCTFGGKVVTSGLLVWVCEVLMVKIIITVLWDVMPCSKFRKRVRKAINKVK
jgi:hypothetical protein